MPPSNKATPAPPPLPDAPDELGAERLYELLNGLSGALTGAVGAFICLYTPDTIVWLDGPPEWATLRSPDEGMAEAAPEGATADQIAITVAACRSLARLHSSLGSHYGKLARELLEHHHPGPDARIELDEPAPDGILPGCDATCPDCAAGRGQPRTH
jgi:hypothetical protein